MEPSSKTSLLGASPALLTWHAAGHSHRHGAHRIFYRDQGQDLGAGVLLCLHGFPTSSWDWHALWPALTTHFRVIAPDLLGFGFSDKPPEHDYSVMEQADIVQSLLQELKIDKVLILAHDLGDTVAQELLARRAARPKVMAVCFLNGGLFPETHRPVWMQRLLLTRAGSLLSALPVEGAFRRSFSAVFAEKTRPSPEALRDHWATIRYHDGQRIMHRLIRYIEERQIQRTRWVSALQTATVPLRLINGALDPVSGAHAQARYRELVPGPDVVNLAHIGHYPQLEDPMATLAAVLSFFERCQANKL